MNSVDIIEGLLAELRKPYLVCICGNFEVSHCIEDRMMYVCKNCGGWMSLKRLCEKNIRDGDDG